MGKPSGKISSRVAVSGSNVPCFHPIPAYQDAGSVQLHPPLGGANLALPCGRCLGCKTSRAQEWATRVVHEMRSHHKSIFATLTYAPEHCPGELVPRHLQLFIKRLRKAARGNHPQLVGNRVRYVACGEYGDRAGRPHYHAILFGLDFLDARRVRLEPYPLWKSPTLESLWGFGKVDYGDVTRASAAYVAGYTVKKIGATHCNAEGVVMEAPFLRASLKPGIGADYARTYASDLAHGFVVNDGAPTRVPRYYKKVLARTNSAASDALIQSAWERHFQRVQDDPVGYAPERLIDGEKIAKRRMELTRSHSL